MSKARQLADFSSVAPDIGRKNLIINGAMQVAQRGTSSTGVTSNGYRVSDRFADGFAFLGTWTIENTSDSPDDFSNSHKLTCTTPNASPTSAAAAYVFQAIEAQNLQQLAFGTASAKEMTLSFYVKSNKTGTASLEVLQSDNSNKMFSAGYTINSADTWEYKTISIPADVAGVINNDNGVGLQIIWWLNSGSNFTGGTYASSWATLNNPNRNVNNLGVGGTTNDYWQITGVQLEVGSVATPFEHRSYGEELALCQRYYREWGGNSGNERVNVGFYNQSTDFRMCIELNPNMRATPTLSVSSDSHWGVEHSNSNAANTSHSLDQASPKIAAVNVVTTKTGTAGHAGQLIGKSSDARLRLDAEL